MGELISFTFDCNTVTEEINFNYLKYSIDMFLKSSLIQLFNGTRWHVSIPAQLQKKGY